MSTTRSSSRWRRHTERELQPLVAQALLRLSDPIWLASYSPLVELPQVQRLTQGSTRLFAEGYALASFLRETVDDVVERLAGDGKVGVLRDMLRGVCDGKSIAQIAGEHGRTCEHFSRHYWVVVTALLAHEIAALNSATEVSYTSGKVRKPSA